MKIKNLIVKEETDTGLNTSYLNTNTGRTISREKAVEQITKNNPTYEGYHVVTPKNGVPYVRSNPDQSKKNNIE